MRNSLVILILMLAIVSCQRDSNIIAPLSTPPSSVSDVKDSISYTFAITKNKLGIFDTLTMTLTAFNQSAEVDTIYVSDHFYSWSLVNSNGKQISGGPTVGSNLISRVLLSPQKAAILYRLAYSMADVFGSPIDVGSYPLQWNLSNGLSFQLTLECGKSENEVTDTSGVISPIYPLKVGNKWTFRTRYVFPNSSIEGDTVTQAIIGEEMINGEKWFLMSSSFINGNQLMTGRQDGIYVYYPNFKESVLRYKYPVSLGEQYNSAYEEWTGYSDSLVTFQMTVDSTSELISTPSSRYQCNKYHAPAVFTTVRGSTTEIVSVDMYLSNIGPVEIVSGNVYTELLSTNVR